MKQYSLLPLLGLLLSLTSCTSNQTNNLATLDKKNAREVCLSSVTHGDSIYHITSQTVWADGTIIVQKTDTIKRVKELKNWNDAPATSLEKAPIYVTVK